MGWRDHPQYHDAYVWIMKPRRVFEARVNMGSASYPILELTYDGVTLGAYTDLEVGMTLLLGSAPGRDDYGRTYVRGDLVLNCATATTINIGYSSRGKRAGEVDVVNNAYITVLDLFEVWKRPSKAGSVPGSVLKDGVWTVTGRAFPVIHCGNLGGVGTLDFVDSDTGVLRESFDFSSSYFTKAGDSWLSRTSDFYDGTIISGSTSSDTATVDFPAGYRWISRINYTASIVPGLPRRFCVAALDPDDVYGVGDHAATMHAYGVKWTRAADGQTLTFDVEQRLDPVDYPLGAVVMLMVRDYTDGGRDTDSVSGYTLKFAGYMTQQRSSGRASRYGNDLRTTITAVDVLGRAKQIRAFPSMIERVSSFLAEAFAHQKYQAELAQYIWYTLVEQTSIPMLSDIELNLDELAAYAFSSFQSSGGSVQSVIAGLAKAMTQLITINSRGVIRIVPDPMRQPGPLAAAESFGTDERTNVVQVAIGNDDWTVINRLHKQPSTGVLRATMQPTSTTPAAALTVAPAQVNVIAPGLVEGQGNAESSNGYAQLTPTVIKARITVGNDYARLNAPEDLVKLTLAHGADVGIEPADATWVTVEAPAADTGWLDDDMTAARCLPLQVDFSIDDATGVMTQQLTVERETEGTPGAVDLRPDTEQIRITTPRTVPVLPPVAPQPVPIWSGDIPVNGWMLSADSAKASKIVALDAVGGFTHQDISSGLGSGSGITGYSNPFDYRHSYAVMSDGIYDTPDMESFAGWGLKRSNLALLGNSSYMAHQAGGSHLRSGWHFAASGFNAIAVTFDDWATSAVYPINGNPAAPVASIALNELCYIAIAPHDANVIFALAPRDDNGLAYIYKSTDGGMTWAFHFNPIATLGIDNLYSDVARQYLEIPYNRSDGSPNRADAGMEFWLYAVGDVHSGQAGRLNIFTVSGIVGSTFWAVGDDNTAATHPMTSFTHDGSYGWFLGGASGGNVYRTQDALATVSSALYSFGTTFWQASVNGWSMNPDVALVWTRGGGAAIIKATVDGGASWFGSNPSFFGAEGCAYGEFLLYPFQ